MGKYEINNSQIGLVGDNSRSDNNNYIMNVNVSEDELIQIVKELNDIEAKLLNTLDRDGRQERLLIDIQEIKMISKQGNSKLVLEKIRSRASQLFYDFSTGVGSGIVASMIYSILNR